ncbi:MAG: signal peptide peptidase SppA [Candidatus Nomurabacteria bacterium]|nr:signal peptide peptidase SppA [Candidatus Nomurabacteria bacterium]USN87958.1 MAG: signal peptide peptidase SppA [Candidatus Nomurabacteria bacterium]
MEKTFGREVAGVFLRVVAVLLTFILILGITDAWYRSDTISDGFCNIGVLPIEGVILPYNGFEDYGLVTTPGMVRDFIASAEKDLGVDGLLLEINSPGGTPVAAEQISQMIRSTSLPTISLIGDIGASGGYLVAAGSNKIIASAMSDVGSIGVTMSYVENSKKNEKKGLTFVELSTGEFKDAGNPNKPLTDAEREKFEADLEIIHNEFVRQVADLRGLSVENVQELADGSTMPGAKAVDAGLVDMVGNREIARQEFANRLGIDSSDVVFCEYERSLLPF